MKSLFLVALLTTKLTICVSQSTKFFIRYFEGSAGLSSGNIRKVLEDKFGFIWIATQDGLFRHDSKNFESYNTELNNSRKIGGSDVRHILIDSASNLLWLSSSYGGVNAIDLASGRVIRHIPQEIHPDLKNNLIKGFAIDKEYIFMGCERGLFKFNLRNNDFIEIPLPDIGSQKGYIDFITLINNDKLLILCRNVGGFVFGLKENKVIQKLEMPTLSIDGNLPLLFHSYSTNQKGKTCITTSQGIFIYNESQTGLAYDSSFSIYDHSPTLREYIIRDAIFDNSGQLWVATNLGLLVCQNKKLMNVTSFSEDFKWTSWLKAIYSIFVDADNNVWLGCQNGLAYLKNRFPSFISYSYCDLTKVRITHSYYLFPLNDSIIYSAAEEGLYKINRMQNRIDIIGKNKTYDFLFIDPFGQIIASNDDGLYVLRENQIIPIETIYREFADFKKTRINSSITINDSCVAMGSENNSGILVWNFKSRQVHHFNTSTRELKLREDIVNNLYFLEKNKFLILSDATLSMLDYQKKEAREIDIHTQNRNEPFNIFFDICRIKDTFFMACYGRGVLKLNRQLEVIGNITTSTGLSNNGVYKVLPWKDSLLFITTNNGLNLYDPERGRITKFFKEDGLHDNAFEETSGTTFKDEILAGGTNGFTVVSPNQIFDNATPPIVYVKNILIERPDHRTNDTSNLMFELFSIPNDALQTTIRFSGINYSVPERTYFSYKISELHKDWISLELQNFINLIGLSPGTYHLLVKAANEDGVWSKPKELILIFLPKWYQAWWSKALGIFLIVAAIYLLYRYRINQIREQEEIRRQIAGDLHDDIGSTLNSIKVFSNLAMMQPGNQEYLMHIKEGTQDAITGIRDIMWVLDDKLDTVSDVINRFEHFARPLAEANQVELLKYIDPALIYHTLKKEEKRNLFLILKEAFNNCIKYAECRQFCYYIKLAKTKRIAIQVKDNGKGFDVTSATQGNGLKNMRERAAQIDYKFSIDSSPLQGTTIEISQA